MMSGQKSGRVLQFISTKYRIVNLIDVVCPVILFGRAFTHTHSVVIGSGNAIDLPRSKQKRRFRMNFEIK